MTSDEIDALFPGRTAASQHLTPLPLVLTVEEAAERLGVGRTVMYALVSSGAVESVRIGRLRRVPTDALVTFLNGLRATDRREGGAASAALVKGTVAPRSTRAATDTGTAG